MPVLQEYKCPCCNGALEFDSGLQKMKCPYCGSEFEMESMRAYDAELENQPEEKMQWDTAAGGQWQPGETEGLRVYICNTCGGQVVGDETTGATECPFCGNPVVIMGQFAGELKPDLVIPFQLDKKAAIETLKKHYNGKRLLPKVFKDENHIKEVKGLYVPVWLFDAKADARARYRATRTRAWSDSRYNYRETCYYAVIRAGNMEFAHVPVDGSSKMDDALMESIEPFDVSKAVDFQTAYLSGYLADKYDVDAVQSEERANERIKNSTQETLESTVVGYSSVLPEMVNVQLKDGAAKYALYPVWLLNTVWNGQKFTFAINGQTGKLAGDLPMDKGAFWRWLLSISGITAAVVFALSYLVWLL